MLLANLGIDTAGRAASGRKTPNPANFLGSEKSQEIKLFAETVGANLLVVDDALTPTQRSNLIKLTSLEVWDRPYTIMRIFEDRAHTAEAKLQVELAKLRYEIPGLKGLGMQMSRLGGGIGTRGPGETEYKRHRRKLERRIKFIERDLETVRKRRKQSRSRRAKENMRVVALVGYTNSGKSTLLRSLSKDDSILVADKLFSTLDTTTRKISFAQGETRKNFLLSDTVGFIRRLPPELVAAFRATLEEIGEASLLLVVLDASDPDCLTQFDIIKETLAEIGADSIPRVIAINKIDKSGEEADFLSLSLGNNGETCVKISALEKNGFKELLDAIDAQ